uniref:Uncharacterized protein n=1 Tax=viral metagenome TaxID=1070528 RepID=A0A6C0LKU3_9ZZZZ
MHSSPKQNKKWLVPFLKYFLVFIVFYVFMN